MEEVQERSNVFFVMQFRELGKTLLCPQLVIRKKLQCRGLVPLYEGLEHGGSSVEEGVEQPDVVPSGMYL